MEEAIARLRLELNYIEVSKEKVFIPYDFAFMRVVLSREIEIPISLPFHGNNQCKGHS